MVVQHINWIHVSKALQPVHAAGIVAATHKATGQQILQVGARFNAGHTSRLAGHGLATGILSARIGAHRGV